MSETLRQLEVVVVTWLYKRHYWAEATTTHSITARLIMSSAFLSPVRTLPFLV